MPFPPDPDLAPLGNAEATVQAAPMAAARTTTSGPRVEPAEPEKWGCHVQLRFPVLVDGERLESLTLRRLTGRDLADLVMDEDSPYSLGARSRALCCGVHVEVLTGLSADDAQEVAEKSRPLLPASIVAAEDAEDEDEGDLDQQT